MYIEHQITGLIMARLFIFDFKNNKYPSWFVPCPHETTCIKLHKQTDLELLYIKTGRFNITVNTTQKEVSEGCLILINPNDSHSAFVPIEQENASYDMIKISMDNIVLNNLPAISKTAQNLIDEKIKFNTFISPEIVKDLKLDIFISEIKKYANYESEQNYMSTFGGIYLLFSSLLSNGLVQKTPEIINYIKKRNGFVLNMIEYFDKNWNKKITSKDAAAEFSYSHEYFCKIFKQNMGKTFTDFLIEIKIHKAKEFLDNGVKSGQVMELVGMLNYSYFYRCFKKIYGHSPEYFINKKN